MIMKAVEERYLRLPILSEDWRRRAPELCDGLDADFVLVDLGPVDDKPRYIIMGLRSGSHSLHFFESLTMIHAPRAEGGLGVEASLFVPLYRGTKQHRGHVAALYCAQRRFADGDVERLQATADRFVTLLSEG